jgi:hypothetical protein
MTNIFAYRATDPREMKTQRDPVGTENNRWLTQVAYCSQLRVAAWGTHGSYRGRDREVLELLPDLHCLGVNKDGSPKHPLYLRKDLKPIPYRKEDYES